MNRFKTECIVLKALNYKDADKIYTLFSRDYGKISAIAHGVRKISSRRAGSLDTLNHVIVEISENHKNFKTINEIKLLNGFRDLKDKYELHEYVYDVMNTVSKNTEEDSSGVSKSFDLLLETILKFQNSQSKIIREFFLNSFRLRFFDILGYQFSPQALSNASRYQLNDTKLKMINTLKSGIFNDNMDEKDYKEAYAILNTFFARV